MKWTKQVLIATLSLLMISMQSKAQVIFTETFNKLVTANYSTAINPNTFDQVFDNVGWTSSSSSGQSCAEVGALCIGRNGSSGGTLSTPAMNLTLGANQISILTFKLKYWGTNSITGSTSSRVIVRLEGVDVFNGQRGVVSIPAGAPNYTAADWTSYAILLPAATAASKIQFVGTSSNYAYEIDDVIVAKATLPTVTTAAATNVDYTSATVGGTINATLLPVTQSGIVWSFSNNNPTTADNVIPTNPLAAAGPFSLNMTGLPVTTTVYYNTFIVTAAGTIYGTASSFTTLTPVYMLVGNPTLLDFGSITIGASSVLPITLTGQQLTPAAGNITVTAPAGFTLSLSASGPFSTSITVPYTGSAFSVPVFVRFTPTAYTSYSGSIDFSGGGAGAINIIKTNVLGRGKLPAPSVTSNMGNDFWLGFGYHAQMADKNADEADLSIYIAAGDKDAVAIVEMPALGGGFTTQTVSVAKGTVQEVSGFPKGDNNNRNPTGLPDSRLFYTGISNRGIHVYSQDGTPISVWMYSYSRDNSAAGSLIFPTNTWNTTYSVQAYGNNSNSAGNPNSYFFVIAEEDNTEVEFTPTVDILDSLQTTTFTRSPAQVFKYNAGQTYKIKLNRGQVFNAISNIISNTGLDLSGTTVKSLNCKKIAVFGGNGRSYVTNDICVSASSGSDNLIQQMFPKVAWGNKYYTVPTKHMEYNTYRINVDDPATVVKVNGTTLSGLTNNYYTYYSNLPLLIEGTKPISVTQFIASESCGTNGQASSIGNNGRGDPEMIILSPASQAINKVTVYSPTFKNGNFGGAYINVVIPKNGVSTFKIDPATNTSQMVDTGNSSYDAVPPFGAAPALIPVAAAFKPYPSDANYMWAQFKVDFPAPHSLVSDVPFNAIAYGVAQGESYGFNAGTLIKNLSSAIASSTPLATAASDTGCVNTPVFYQITLPYQPTGLLWDFGGLFPSVPVLQPTADSTYSVDGFTRYVFKLKTGYNFPDTGSFTVRVLANNPVSDGCSADEISFVQKILPRPKASFTPASPVACVNSPITFTENSNTYGTSVAKWQWNFGDNTSATTKTVQKSFATAGTFDAKLFVLSHLGCLSDTVNNRVVINPLPTVTFGAIPVACNTQAAFALTTGSPAGGTYTGTGVSNGQFNPAVSGVGTFTLTYTYTNANGCVGSATQTITVNAAATSSIGQVSAQCIDGNAVTLTGTPQGGVFAGRGVTGTSFSPATAGVGTHAITYTFPTNPCILASNINIVVNAKPTVDAGPGLMTIQGVPVNLQGSGTQGSTFAWTPTTGLNNPAIASPVATPQQTTHYTLTATLNGCTASDTMTLTVNLPCEVDPSQAFTPNGDGYNDKWIIGSLNTQCILTARVDVYNRYGALVYHANDYHNDWDGRYKGDHLPDGTYYFIITYKKAGSPYPFTKKGNVTIMR